MKLRWPWSRNERHPSIAANHEYFKRFDSRKPIECYNFVALDTELTGLDQRNDAIVAIGAVRIEGLQIAAGKNFYSHVRPKRSLPKGSTLIHRLTPDQLEDAPELKRVLPDLVDFIGADLIVGHWIGLDMAFINRAAKRLLHGPLHNPYIDSMKLARVYQERQNRGYYAGIGVGSLSLTALSNTYNLPRFEQHDALGDAFQAACLFLFLVRKLQTLGCRTFADLRLIQTVLGAWY